MFRVHVKAASQLKKVEEANPPLVIFKPCVWLRMGAIPHFGLWSKSIKYDRLVEPLNKTKERSKALLPTCLTLRIPDIDASTWRVFGTVLSRSGKCNIRYIRHLYGVYIMRLENPTNDNGLIQFLLSFPCWSTIFNLNL